MARFIAKPTALGHFFDKRRNFVGFAGLVVGRGFVDIFDDVHQNVETNYIRGAEGGGFGPANSRSSAGIDFFNRHAERRHKAKSIQHGVGADAIGDEIGRILGDDDAFAKAAVAKIRKRGENFRRSLRPGNDFYELHVARGVEKVGAGPVLLKFFGQAFGDEMNGKTGSVGSDDGTGLAELRNFRKQIAFDFKIFGDDFDDPIGIGDAGKVVFKITDGDAGSKSGAEESSRLGFFGGVDAGKDKFVAVGLRGVFGDDVEKEAGQAGIREVSSNARAHSACAEDNRFHECEKS